MNQEERPSNLRNTGGETALGRLCDRESVRTLSLVQRMIHEEIRQSGTSRLETIWLYYVRQEMLCIFDQMLTFAEDYESQKAQKDSAADTAPDDTGESDDE